MTNLTQFDLIVRSKKTNELVFRCQSSIGLAPMSIGDSFILPDGAEYEIVKISHRMAQIGVDALGHGVEVLVDTAGK